MVTSKYATWAQVAKIQFELWQTELRELGGQLRPHHLSISEASDLISLIYTDDFDLIEQIVKDYLTRGGE